MFARLLPCALVSFVLLSSSVLAQTNPSPVDRSAPVPQSGLQVQSIRLDPIPPLIAVNQAGQYREGTQLSFVVKGTPGAQGLLRITNVREPIALTESKPGTYTAVYRIPENANLSQNTVVVAELEKNGTAHRSTSRIGGPLADNPFANLGNPGLLNDGTRP